MGEYPTEGVSLGYRSARPIDAVTKEKLDRQVADLNARHDWWAGSLELGSTEPSGHLEGRSELVLVGYEGTSSERVDVDEDDDAFMAWMDLCVIIDWLCERSGEHGIDWDLSFVGEPVGCIRNGDEDDDLAVFIAELGSVAGATFDERDDERAERLDEHHSRRKSR